MFSGGTEKDQSHEKGLLTPKKLSMFQNKDQN